MNAISISVLSLAIALTLTGCELPNWEFVVAKTEVDAEAKTCTFDIEFPDDYAGGERGTQQFTVTQMTDEEAVLRRGHVTYAAGDTLRKKCREYLGGS